MDTNTLTGISTLVALIIGYILKNKTPIENKLIPWINFAVAFLTQVLANITPANASVFSGVLGKSVLSMLANAGLVTILSVGSHSTLKNTLEYFKQRALEQAQAAAAAAIQKQQTPQ